MTRLEQIGQASDERHYSDNDKEIYVDGAQWADRHPAWVSVEDALPDRYKTVLVCYDVPCIENITEKNYTAAFLNKAGEWMDDGYDSKNHKIYHEVTHWLYICPPDEE